jgi:Kelch motif protein
MANGTFQPGTWIPLPSNCTRSFTLTYQRCAEYGWVVFTECLLWAVNVEKRCVEGVWESVKHCSWWSWLFCVLWAVVVTFVCTLFAFVVIVFCALVTLVEMLVCIVWTLISIIFCLSNAKGGTAFLLTDGTVMMQESKSADLYWIGVPWVSWSTSRWWKLTPDELGRYENGTWSRLADSRVGRTAYASSVLADGRVVVCGGEYSDASGTIKPDENNSCEIYDPVANRWSPFASPTTPGSPGTVWDEIGDAACTLLPDGTLLMGAINTPNVAKLDPVTLTWTAMKPRPEVGSSTEDSWVLMPDNTVAAPSCIKPPTTWVYDISTDKWTKGNEPPVSPVNFATNEIGPGLLRYDGTAFFLGASEHTAIYSPTASPQWSNGPDLPDQDGSKIGIEDGPAALLVNGNVLFGAGVGLGNEGMSTPSWFFRHGVQSDERPAEQCRLHVRDAPVVTSRWQRAVLQAGRFVVLCVSFRRDAAGQFSARDPDVSHDSCPGDDHSDLRPSVQWTLAGRGLRR